MTAFFYITLKSTTYLTSQRTSQSAPGNSPQIESDQLSNTLPSSVVSAQVIIKLSLSADLALVINGVPGSTLAALGDLVKTFTDPFPSL